MVRKFLESVIAHWVGVGLERFRGLHAGESCYIFGDGPSLKWMDLRHFQRFPALCCGHLPFHVDFTKLDVRYCSLVEPWGFCPSWMQDRDLRQWRSIGNAYRAAIQANRDKHFFVHVSNMFSLREPNVHYVFRRPPSSALSDGWVFNNLDLFGGSMRAALTLMWFLGFSQMYLVGFDAWAVQPSRNGHWYEVGEGIPFQATNLDHEFLDLLKTRVSIYTIGVEGKSRNVEYLDYESYTGCLPQYRENSELLQPGYCDVLATYPGYRIR
jgi:hypothetical protein